MPEPKTRPEPPPRPRPSPGRRPAGRAGRPEPRGPASTALPPEAAASCRPRSWRDIPAALRWLGAALVVLIAAIAIFVALFRWNWLRGPIDDYASARLHRQVVIHGDLSGQVWSWTPSLTARDVSVAQPAWAGRAPMATLPRLTLAIDLRALLHGKLILAVVDAERPSVAMRRDASGRDNWTFGEPKRTPTPLKLPPIRRFTIEGGRVTLEDARRRLHFTGQISSNERINGYGRGRFTLTGQGDMNGAPFQARIVGGPLINIDPDKPYPFQTDVRAGATHVTAQGAITRPFDLGVMRASGNVSGDDLANLYQLTGVALPNSPPYVLSGEMSRNGDTFDLAGIHGRLGSSDLAGHVVVREEADGRRRVTGALASRRLKLADMTPLIGGAPRGVLKGAVTSPKQQAEAARLSAEHRVLSDTRLDVARMRETDADVRYRAESVDAGPLPIRQLSLHARLDHGLLIVDPLALTLPQGALSGHVRLDARGATPLTAVDLTLARAQVQELLPAARFGGGSPPLQGLLEARARLTGSGDSVRRAAGTANGVVSIAIPRGQMRQLFAELLGIDVGRSLFLYLSKDQKPTPVRCAVAQFRAHDGVLTTEHLLIDTAAVRAEGGGTIDLRNETLSLAINGKPKHFRLLRIAAPITLKGRLDNPKLGVDLSKAAPQVGVAIALGALVTPLAAILPFISTGGARDADCGALLAGAAAQGARVGGRTIAAKH